MQPTNLFMTAATIVAGATMSCSALAHTAAMEGNDLTDLESLVDQSSLIFVGYVVEVDYRMSQPRSKDEVSLPHTIVTYEIDETLYGEPVGDFFAMRFEGGSDGRGGFLHVSNVPLFQVGDEDLLFVSGNGEDGCPLVMCEWGRYRISNGDTYNTRGVPVQSIDNNDHVVARGLPMTEFRSFSYPSPTFDGLLENREFQDRVRMLTDAGISVDDLRRQYEEDSPARIEVLLHLTESSTANAPEDVGTRFDDLNTANDSVFPMAVGQFMAGVSDIVNSKNRAAPDTLVSIDPDATFFSSMAAVPMAPPTPQPGTTPAPGPQSPAEADELEILRSQNFNPVIK